MKFAIVDSNYSSEGHMGMASTWLKWEMQKRHIKPADISNADVILMTVSSQQGVVSVRSKYRKIKKINKSAKIILGGGGCYAPAVFDPYIDVACVGEGKRFIDVLFKDGIEAAMELPEAWVPGETRKVYPYHDFPWELPPIRHPDGTVRLFGARGCKFNCLFCQTGWESTYRPNPNMEKVISFAKEITSRGERLAIVTNDAAEDHIKLVGQQEFISVTLHNTIKNIPKLTRKHTKSVRFGVEGVSYRLRLAVGKPIDYDILIAKTAELLSNGVGVRWFFIPGLPGENDEDWNELRYAIMEIKRNIKKGVVMMNFHSYIPQPATPLSVLPLVDEYWERYDDFRTWFFNGLGFTRRVQLVNPSRYKGRLVRSMQSMAATEAELRRGWFNHDNKNWRVVYNKSPDELRRIARIYAKRVGMNINHESMDV